MKFRTYDKERHYIAARNRARTAYILEQAGIQKNHPDYMRYFKTTIINVHNTYRFSYKGETEADLEKVFETLIDDIGCYDIDVYESLKDRFRDLRAQQQYDAALDEEHDELKYDDVRATLNTTIQNGMKLREKRHTDFPKEFYNSAGSLQRLIYEIPPEDQEESAMANIDAITSKYKEVFFDENKNRFVVDGYDVGPQKFFTARRDSLEKFFKKFERNSKVFDSDDNELLEILKSGDFQRFLALRKERGLSSDRKNEALRTALHDEVVFYELQELWQKEEKQTPKTLLSAMRQLAEKFSKYAALVQKESEKDSLERIDRIMFSVVPEDVAVQSTFKDWKSCMHANGIWHKSVVDSIGHGSIVAYGYDSKNPSKIISRLLINPYHTKDMDKVAYHVNERIYGHENLGFRKAVEAVVNYFNNGREGVFYFDESLYPDDYEVKPFMLFSVKNGMIDLRKAPINGQGDIEIKKATLPSAQGFILPLEKKLVLDDVALGKNSDFRNVKGLKIWHGFEIAEGVKLPSDVEFFYPKVSGFIPDNTDFSRADNLILCNNVHIGKNVKFPRDVVLENANVAENSDLSMVERLTLQGKIKFGENVKLPSQALVRECVDIADNTDLSVLKNVKLYGNVKFGKNVKLPENISGYVSRIEGFLPDGTDLSYLNVVTFENRFKLGEKVKLPEVLKLSEAIVPNGTDLSGLKTLRLDGHVQFGKNVKLPADIGFDYLASISGYVPDQTDLSKSSRLTLHGHVQLGKDVKLPGHLSVKNVVLEGQTDLSRLKSLSATGKIEIGQDVKLPSYVRMEDVVIADGTDLSAVENLSLRGKVVIGRNVKLPRNTEFEIESLSGHIPEGTDLRDMGELILTGDVYLPHDILFPRSVRFKDGFLRENSDLSRVENLIFSGHITMGRHVLFPDDVMLEAATVEAGSDLSQIRYLQINRYAEISPHVKFPQKIYGSYGIGLSGCIPDGLDLSAIRCADLSGEVGKNIIYPSRVNFRNVVRFKDERLDLSAASKVCFSDTNLKNKEIVWPKDAIVDIKENVVFSEDYHLNLSECKGGFVDPSVKCASVELPRYSSAITGIILPKQVKTVSTLFLSSCIKVGVPFHTKVIDDNADTEEKISLYALREKGVSLKHLAELQHDRMFNKMKNKIQGIFKQRNDSANKDNNPNTCIKAKMHER